ncbi:Btz domain-containing protein [Mycena indigotica]|uniref:Btz domain-containing protein n=1 Tax=Mycena indigotica TaxID=2126181 RepID=A0A8H6SLL7_9AGAR|nr:Btz domain-containing protein [Mycena indigotica]KAF7302015.1 Btz domain-containing protein [Mycena indigotica]
MPSLTKRAPPPGPGQSRSGSDSSVDSDDASSATDDDDDESDTEPVSRHPTPNEKEKEKGKQPFFAAPTAWADMVEEGGANLPVVEFGEFDGKVDVADPAPRPPAANGPNRRPGQSARQAYQQRLETDPAFVPVVGEFWGHDDRLLDKDLRSLSGWWRGRWQGRGRARGTGFFMRGRGRGGFVGGQAQPEQQQQSQQPQENESPMDRPWTHDGFEEMRRREEARRGAAPSQPTRGTSFRGRPFGPQTTPPARALGRPWYIMKPELMWTKQHEGFLFLDPALKPRPGQPAGLRVRLPGGQPNIIRAIPRASRTTKPPPKTLPTNTFVVRLPSTGKEKQKEKEKQEPPTSEPGAATTVAAAANASLRPDADGWVSPDAAAVALATVSSPPAGPPPTLPSQPPAFYPFAPPPPLMAFPHPSAGPAFTAPQPVPYSSPSPQGFVTPPGFSTPSPGFGTPPAYSAPLPPGVAVDPRGGLYELASGRPVLLFGGFHGHHSPSPSMNGHHPLHPMHGHGHTPSMSAPPEFAFARPNVRVEIRKPDGLLEATSPVRPSPLSRDSAEAGVNGSGKKLRTGAAAFVPSHSGSGGAGGTGSGVFYPPQPAYEVFDPGYEQYDPALSYEQGYEQQQPGMYDAYGAYVPAQFYYHHQPQQTTYYHHPMPVPAHQHQHQQQPSLGGEQQQQQQGPGPVYYA